MIKHKEISSVKEKRAEERKNQEECGKGQHKRRDKSRGCAKVEWNTNKGGQW